MMPGTSRCYLCNYGTNKTENMDKHVVNHHTFDFLWECKYLANGKSGYLWNLSLCCAVPRINDYIILCLPENIASVNPQQ